MVRETETHIHAYKHARANLLAGPGHTLCRLNLVCVFFLYFSLSLLPVGILPRTLLNACFQANKLSSSLATGSCFVHVTVAKVEFVFRFFLPLTKNCSRSLFGNTKKLVKFPGYLLEFLCLPCCACSLCWFKGSYLGSHKFDKFLFEVLKTLNLCWAILISSWIICKLCWLKAKRNLREIHNI